MITIQEAINENLEEGCFVGNLKDFLSAEDIQALKEFKEEAKDILLSDIEKYFVCRYNYQPPNDEPQKYPDKISMTEEKERDEYIKSENLLVWQKWYESSFPPGMDLTDVPFRISKKIIKKFYPEYEDQIEHHRISHGNLTLFRDGHFICKHNDGRNEGRICVILIYLNEENEYSEDTGGELVLENNSSKTIEIKPIFGNFCMMDFTKNNIAHWVNEVKNGFNRFTYLNFITIPKKENNLI